MRQRFFRFDRGYSLVELIAILILISIVAIFVMPRFFSRGAFDARSLDDEAQSMVRYAQKLAVARNGRIYVCATSNGISLGTDDSCAELVLLPSSKPATLSRSDLLISPARIFYFDGLGKPFNKGDTESSTFVKTRFDLTTGGTTQSFFVEQETGYVHQ